MEIRVADEPAGQLARLIALLEQYFDAIGDAPRSVWSTSLAGRSGRTRAFSWDALEKLGSDGQTASVSSYELRSRPLQDRPGEQVVFDMSLELRRNPDLKLPELQPPFRLFIAVHSSLPVFDAVPAASSAFVARCAEVLPVVHGGITRLDNLAQAESETRGTATHIERQPATFQRRREHDWWMNQAILRTKCRRLYWTTLLGPALAQAAGGADAARDAGAFDVRGVNGSLIVRAMEGPPRDSLDPEFLAATVRLRRWLWPHTFQNPLDAVGFEAEVGLPVPEPA
jgi:hypothetical protein